MDDAQSGGAEQRTTTQQQHHGTKRPLERELVEVEFERRVTDAITAAAGAYTRPLFS
jgi:hypothetical protein